jgi:hypothetical protein
MRFLVLLPMRVTSEDVTKNVMRSTPALRAEYAKFVEYVECVECAVCAVFAVR